MYFNRTCEECERDANNNGKTNIYLSFHQSHLIVDICSPFYMHCFNFFFLHKLQVYMFNLFSDRVEGACARLSWHGNEACMLSYENGMATGPA